MVKAVEGNRQTDRQTGRQADRQTDRQTDRHRLTTITLAQRWVRVNDPPSSNQAETI